jgi:PAS domain-containing protein
MRMPALAVVGPDHQIVRSTETFRRRYEKAATLCESSPELDLVLKGQANAAVVELGGLSVAIEAATGATGERQAVLTLAAEDQEAESEPAMSTVREAADESAAMVWVKDLDGRYLYANARFEDVLETSCERLRGKTDAELPPVETVDGPRLNYARDGLEEPLQLEYSVPAYEGRPPMAAFRFPLRDADGHPIGTCGVAAPSTEAQVASDEAVRLMELERWSRLDPLDLRAELLEQWHVQTAPNRAEGGPLLPAFDVKPKPHDDGRLAPPGDRESEGAAAQGEGAAAQGEVSGAASAAPVAASAAPVAASEAPAAASEAPAAESEAAAAQDEAPERQPGQREEEWVRQLRQAARIAPPGLTSEPAAVLQTDLQLARKWSERAEQLQGELQQVHAQLRQAQAEAQEAQAEVRQAHAEAQEAQAEAQEAIGEAERARAAADEASSAAEVARSELAAALAQLEALRDPAEAALRLSGELERTLAAEREREDELAHALAQIRARLGELDGTLGPRSSLR